MGGQGLGVVELCVLVEEQGAALAPRELLPTTAAALAIDRAGSPAQRETWLPRLAAGQASAGLGWRRVGEPALVAAGADPDLVVLFGEDGCTLLDQSAAVVAPLETIDPLRWYGVADDDGEELPGDPVLARAAATVVVAAELLGVAQRALEMTVAYVKDRKQFGVPVGGFQGVSHRCAEMLLHAEGARSAVYGAAWTADAAPDELPAAAALATYVASQAALSVTASAIQAHGGIGFTWEADIHWWYKRAQLSAQLLGTAGQHRSRLGELLVEAARVRTGTIS